MDHALSAGIDMLQMPFLPVTGSDAMCHHGQDCKTSASDKAEEDDKDKEHDRAGDDNSMSD